MIIRRRRRSTWSLSSSRSPSSSFLLLIQTLFGAVFSIWTRLNIWINNHRDQHSGCPWHRLQPGTHHLPTSVVKLAFHRSSRKACAHQLSSSFSFLFAPSIDRFSWLLCCTTTATAAAAVSSMAMTRCCRVQTEWLTTYCTERTVAYKEERTNGWTQARSSRSHTEMNVVVVVVFWYPMRYQKTTFIRFLLLLLLWSSSSSSSSVVVVVHTHTHTKSGEIREHNTQGKEGGRERGCTVVDVPLNMRKAKRRAAAAAPFPPNGQQHTAMSSFPPSRLLCAISVWLCRVSQSQFFLPTRRIVFISRLSTPTTTCSAVRNRIYLFFIHQCVRYCQN